MARPDSEKCRLCSKLSTREAQQRHGPDGDGCWDAAHCHNRRSYYRHRGVRNYNRKQRRWGQSSLQEALAQDESQQDALPTNALSQSTEKNAQLKQVATLEVPTITVPAAVVHWYRETKNSPLHAVGAELWLGNDRVARVEPIHCLGLTELQVKTLLIQILERFSQHCGTKLERFRASVELHPLNCPIRPCPLYPEGRI